MKAFAAEVTKVSARTSQKELAKMKNNTGINVAARPAIIISLLLALSIITPAGIPRADDVTTAANPRSPHWAAARESDTGRARELYEPLFLYKIKSNS